MTEALVVTSALLLALLFGWSAVAKALRPRRWREALSVYRPPRFLEPVVAVVVPLGEAAICVALLAGALRPAGALATALLCAFCAALLRARAIAGDKVPCGCFGGQGTHDYRLLLARNVALLVPAVLLMAIPARSPWSGLDALDPVPVVLVALGLGVIAWTAAEVARAFRKGRPS